MTFTAVRIVLVEDHPLTRAGLRAVLTHAGHLVCAEAADGQTGLRLILAEKPDIAVIDLELPALHGTSLIKELVAAGLGTRVVVLTMSEHEPSIRDALGAGAAAYCVKASAPETLLEAIAAVAKGGAYFDPAIARTALRVMSNRDDTPRAPDEQLNNREIDILRLVAQGHTNAEIATAMHIAYGTVKGHLADILEKLSAADRAQAAVIAYRRGLL